MQWIQMQDRERGPGSLVVLGNLIRDWEGSAGGQSDEGLTWKTDEQQTRQTETISPSPLVLSGKKSCFGQLYVVLYFSCIIAFLYPEKPSSVSSHILKKNTFFSRITRYSFKSLKIQIKCLGSSLEGLDRCFWWMDPPIFATRTHDWHSTNAGGSNWNWRACMRRMMKMIS